MWTQSAKAVFTAIVFGYLAPFTILWLFGFAIAQIHSQSLLDVHAFLSLVYLFFFAPVFTGYFAAKRSPSLPIYHGLAAVVFSLALFILKSNPQPLWLVGPLSLVLGVIGARRFKMEDNHDNNL